MVRQSTTFIQNYSKRNLVVVGECWWLLKVKRMLWDLRFELELISSLKTIDLKVNLRICALCLSYTNDYFHIHALPYQYEHQSSLCSILIFVSMHFVVTNISSPLEQRLKWSTRLLHWCLMTMPGVCDTEPPASRLSQWTVASSCVRPASLVTGSHSKGALGIWRGLTQVLIQKSDAVHKL